MKQLASLLSLLFALTLLSATRVDGSPGATLYIQHDGVSVHQAPNADAPVVLHLDRGRKLKELRRQGSWVKGIIYGEIGKEGWVKQSQVGSKPLADATAESQEPEEDTIVGPIATPKPKTPPPLHTFRLRFTGTVGKLKGRCRYITASGATKRFKLGPFVNKAYQVKAKAIRCFVKALGFGGRLTVKLWTDGKISVSRTLRPTLRSIGALRISTSTLRISTPWDWN